VKLKVHSDSDYLIRTNALCMFDLISSKFIFCNGVIKIAYNLLSKKNMDIIFPLTSH
jgi:hypothetical protein